MSGFFPPPGFYKEQFSEADLDEYDARQEQAEKDEEHLLWLNQMPEAHEQKGNE
jgi:hypothetical protein